MGATYFHNDLSNVVGFNGMFETLNLGSAITQGVETEIKVMPIPELTFTLAYTYLETEKTSSLDISQPEGARLPVGPGTNFTSRFPISGAGNSTPRSRRNS